MPFMNQTLSNCMNYETSTVWEEAGFIPPVFCMTVIEFLHRLNNNDMENIYDAGIISGMICDTDNKTFQGCSKYIFTDMERMHRFAEEMNIPVRRMSDTEIADEILCRLIYEYTGIKTNNIKESGIMEILYKISECIA